MEIMNHIEKQLTRSQQGWVDDLAQVLWVHRTLLRNSQKETPFSLTYGSEAIISIAENAVTKVTGKNKGWFSGRRVSSVIMCSPRVPGGRERWLGRFGSTKIKESKEVASIEEAYYQNKLHRKPSGMAGSSHEK
ncbi:reverse transcriptase domain-containing protein [Tanacetum coccineum]